LRLRGLECLELPTQHINLVSAFNEKSRRIKKQALLTIIIAGYTVEQVVLVSPQLLTDIILGLDFLVDNAAAINFPDRTVSLQIYEEFRTLEFLSAKEATQNRVKETVLKDQGECFALRPTHPSATAQLSDEQNLGQPQQLSHPLVVARD
jgi:hypothetical protein